jgi:uracil phosphoribosyltransferase
LFSVFISQCTFVAAAKLNKKIMVVNLSNQHSLVSNWVAALRDINVQTDRMTFRRNLERIAEVIAYEISKELDSKIVPTETPLGTAQSKVLVQQPVLATILRAGLPMHNGLLNYFDSADNAFIAAYRKHNVDDSFEIALSYVSCPELTDRTVILSDPMLATGSSIIKTIQYLRSEGAPKKIHVVCAIASQVGIDLLQRAEPSVKIWCGDIDEELTAKSYIVPGLGDAGDLAFGEKLQN